MVLEAIATINQAVNNFVWGIPAMVCIIGVGLLLSVRTGFCRYPQFPGCDQNHHRAYVPQKGCL